MGRRWHGLVAGIKLTSVIFPVYLVLIGSTGLIG
jgi:hypothetical protein